VTALLEVERVRTEFRTKRGTVHAINDVSFTVDRGEIVGIVGESGSGKSTAVRSIIRLVRPPGEVVAGRAALDGSDLLAMSRSELRRTRGVRVGFVAQNPFGALNPVYRVERQFANIVRAHRQASRAEIRALATRLLQATGIPDPERVLRGYAHQLSGGMAQRVVIAMALSLDPALLIADEPTTALDLTVQRQLLDTLRSLIRDDDRSMLLVTHDLSVVATYCDRVLVMYAGKIIEQGPTHTVFARPAHPYTEALLKAIPGSQTKPVALRGMVPDLVDYPRGCPYRARCARATERCLDQVPELRSIDDDRLASCHFPTTEEPVRHAVGTR
jgi:oligopeptide/dipeptide ABC transporter ATP-binding protein